MADGIEGSLAINQHKNDTGVPNFNDIIYHFKKRQPMTKVIVMMAFVMALTACSTTDALDVSTTTQTQAQKDTAKAILDKGIAAYNVQDYASALPLFIQADKLGHMKAPRYLGLMYLNGDGVAQSNQQAFDYFSKAASNGDITGQYWLGYCYERGLGVVQDVNQAIRWYQESAKRGDVISAPAMIALGRLYEQGLGVEKDINQAISLYHQALNAGDDSAKAALERLQTYP